MYGHSYTQTETHTPVWHFSQTLHIADTGPASSSSWSRSGGLCSLAAAAHLRCLRQQPKRQLLTMFIT